MSMLFALKLIKQSFLLLVIASLALGCRDFQYSSEEQVNQLEQTEEEQSSEGSSLRTLVKSHKEANLVLQEKSLPEVAKWQGFYQAIQQENSLVLDGRR